MACSIPCKKCGWSQAHHSELDPEDPDVKKIIEGYESPLLSNDERGCDYEPESENILHFKVGVRLEPLGE